jgi:uncharacterized membrane protein YfcA
VYIATSGAALESQAALIAAASVGVVVGTFAGVPTLRRIPERVYRPLVGVLLILLGLSLLLLHNR